QASPALLRPFPHAVFVHRKRYCEGARPSGSLSHPSPLSWLPSSQLSQASTCPLPQLSVHRALHPSPLSWFPSSHSSETARTASPQVAISSMGLVASTQPPSVRSQASRIEADPARHSILFES